MTVPGEFYQVPEKVEAMRLEPGTDNWKDVCDWLQSCGMGPSHLGGGVVSFGPPSVRLARPGDWVVRNGRLGWAVMNDDLFQQRFAAVVPGTSCVLCGASTLEHHHGINQPLVEGLAALDLAGGGPINLRALALTRNQWDNFQKLRYFGLVQRVTVDGRRRRGVWEITDLGRRFLRGQAKVPKYVWTFRGEPTRTGGPEVDVTTVLPGYQHRGQWAAEALPMAVPSEAP